MFADESLVEPQQPSQVSASEPGAPLYSDHDAAARDQDQIPRGRSAQRWAEERQRLQAKAHECPMPKPSGRLGQLLGFMPGVKRVEEMTQEKPPVDNKGR